MKFTINNLPAFAELPPSPGFRLRIATAQQVGATSRRGKRFTIGTLRAGEHTADFQSAVSRISNPQAPRRSYAPQAGSPRHSRLETCATSAFSMVELLVTMTLLTLIVLALMAVFSSTQQAFRAGVTQTTALEGGRAAMDMMASDLRAMVPSDGQSNYFYNGGGPYLGAMNFFVTNNDNQWPPYLASGKYVPLVQPLPGTTTSRTNLLQWFFVLGRVNTKWTGTGYIVNSATNSPLYPLYRFYAETNISVPPVTLFQLFQYDVYYGQWSNMSHVMDGVVHLVVRAYDANGYWLTNGYRHYAPDSQYAPYSQTNPPNVWFSPPEWGEVGYHFYSNAVPASVELQLGVLEDRTLQRAESLGVPGLSSSSVPGQWAYLQSQSGHVQVFRQRVTIPNLDPTAYP